MACPRPPRPESTNKRPLRNGKSVGKIKLGIGRGKKVTITDEITLTNVKKKLIGIARTIEQIRTMAGKEH